MRSHSIPHPRIFDIDQTIFETGLPDDLADRRIMNVGYFGEKMMLDLEIESAHQPGYHRVTRSEIRGSFDLMYRPFVLHLARGLVGNRESRMLHRMRQLKDHTQHKPGYQGEDGKADHPVKPAQPVDRKANEQERMENLETPEHEVV